MNKNNALSIIRRRRRRKDNDNGPGRLLVMAGVTLALLIGLLVVTGISSVFGVYAYFAKDLPAPEAIAQQSQQAFKTTKIYDRTGRHVLYEIFDPQWGNRTVVPLGQIPQHLINATIAIEDRNFYQNPGIDLRGIARAAYYDLIVGRPVQGGSSITQQLVKNVLIPPEERYQKTYSRKIKEAILALEITRRYPKDQILEWYLNTISYGNLAYGVEAAAEAYFGKHVQDLDLAECAMLAALPQAPARNSPLENPQEARKRQHLVLDAMYRQGYITYEEIVAAKAEELHYVRQRFDILAPHFVMYIRRLLEERYDPTAVYQGGLKVYTTLDLDMQKAAEQIARQHVRKLQEENRNVSNAAVVVIKPSTGEILTMLGSVDYFDEEIAGQVNVALASRQPGSAFKPFTYATAFAQGYTPATMVMDVRSSFPDPPNPPYVPENYDREYHGPQLFRYALGNSYNVPAVKVLDMVGVSKVIDTAHRLGINTLRRDYYGLSLTLGGGEITLLDMTYAYGVFANNGVMAGRPVPPEELRPGFRELDPVAILRVEDSTGQVLEEFKVPETKPVLSPQLAYLINSILSDNEARTEEFGPNSMLKLSRQAAVKTGSTNDWRDAWTIGYTPQLVTGVWVGNSDNKPMNKVPGSRGAAPIWHDLMEMVLAPLPVENFAEPPGLERVEICATSGLLPTDNCPHRRMEVFIQGTAPTTYCNVHQTFRICKPSGKLATVYCPPDQVESQVFEIYPSEAADWVRENNIPQPPTEYDDVYGPNPASGEVAITNPKPYAYVRAQVTIEGNAKSPDFQLYRLEYGEGLDPAAWIQIGPDHYNSVDGGGLEVWDTSQLNGLYTLQLSVVERSGNYKQAAMQVTVNNTPPTVRIVHPQPEAVYVMEDDEWVSIQAEAMDNVSMDRVEFYLDGQLINMSTVAPYNKKWVITMAGPGPESHVIHAIAYDAAGNITESEKVTISVMHKKEG